MKIRHGIITSIILFIGAVIFGNKYLPIDHQAQEMLTTIFSILWYISLGLIVYLILRNIFRAIKGAVTGTPAGDYQAEARKACEKITPKPGKNATPPWEG